MEKILEDEPIIDEKINIDDSEFSKKGGKVRVWKETVDSRYIDGKAPQHWICGVGENGELIDPPGVDPKNILHELNSEGKYEGVNPLPEDIDEMKKWRSDWNNPNPKGKN